MNSVVDVTELSSEDKQKLKTLTSPPQVAWFTVILCAALLASYLGTVYLCVAGVMPLWTGCIINALVGYFAFSPMHDGLHRAVSKNQRFNDIVCKLGVLLMSPSGDQRMFRYIHILHHRYGLGPEDPDRELKGAWWTLPFRWAFLDVLYLTYVLRNPSKIATPYLKGTIRQTIILTALVIALCVAGYGMEVLMLWFIPTRITFLFIAFAFLWLPHVPHTISQQENYTLATTVRHGWEPLMGVLLQGHHYHLIHHLYPAAPFYNTVKIYKLIEAQLHKKHDLAIQHKMGLFPQVRRAGA